MAKPRETFPAVAYALEQGDEMHEHGRRFRLDQLDGGQYFFFDKGGMEEFVNLHGFVLVNEDEMIRMRSAYDSVDEED